MRGCSPSLHDAIRAHIQLPQYPARQRPQVNTFQRHVSLYQWYYIHLLKQQPLNSCDRQTPARQLLRLLDYSRVMFALRSSCPAGTAQQVPENTTMQATYVCHISAKGTCSGTAQRSAVLLRHNQRHTGGGEFPCRESSSSSSRRMSACTHPLAGTHTWQAHTPPRLTVSGLCRPAHDPPRAHGMSNARSK